MRLQRRKTDRHLFERQPERNEPVPPRPAHAASPPYSGPMPSAANDARCVRLAMI